MATKAIFLTTIFGLGKDSNFAFALGRDSCRGLRLCTNNHGSKRHRIGGCTFPPETGHEIRQ